MKTIIKKIGHALDYLYRPTAELHDSALIDLLFALNQVKLAEGILNYTEGLLQMFEAVDDLINAMEEKEDTKE